MRPPFVALSLAADTVDAYPHPDLAPPGVWPGVVLIVIVIGFFVTAMVLGPIVRAIMQDELPPLEDPPDDAASSRPEISTSAPGHESATDASRGEHREHRDHRKRREGKE